MTNLKKILPVVALIMAFGFGYYMRDLQQHKTILKQERAERKLVDKKIEVSNKNAQELENELIEVKQHEQNIISKAIQAKEVNRNSVDCNCFDDDFIKLFNNQNRIFERILSGEHDAALPNSITGP